MSAERKRYVMALGVGVKGDENVQRVEWASGKICELHNEQRYEWKWNDNETRRHEGRFSHKM